MSLKAYKNAPLVMALIDLRFTEIPGFKTTAKSTTESNLYSKVSDLGFKHKNIKKIPNVGVEMNGAKVEEGILLPEFLKHKIHLNDAWIFQDLSKTTSIYVSDKNISIKTTKYINHSDFINLFSKVLNCVNDVFPKLSSCALQRIGARYINLIVPKSDNLLDAYIKPEWMYTKANSFPFEAKNGSVNAINNNYETESGMLRIQSIQFQPKKNTPIQILPTELLDPPEVGLNIEGQPWWSDSFAQLKPYAALDIDLFSEYNDPLNNDFVINQLFEMRKISKPAFEMCITDYAQCEWGKIE